MTKRLLILLLLSACVLAYRAADFVQAMRSVPEAASFGRVDLRNGRMVVIAVPAEDLDGHPTAAARIGLKVDDAVVAFERPDGSRVSVTGLNLVGETMKSLPREGGGAMLVLRKAGNAEREVRLPLLARQRPGPITMVTRIALNLLLPLLAVATALLIGFLRPDDGHAFLAGLLFLCFSALFGVYFWTLPPGFRELAAVVHTGLATLFAYAFMRFFLVFPSPGPIDRRLPWLKHALLLPVLCLAALSVTISLAAGTSLVAAERVASALSFPGAETSLTVLYVGMLLLGLGSGVWRAFAAPTPDERRRMGIVIAGAAAGLLPVMAIVLYIVIAGAATPAVWMTPIVMVTLPIFPLSFIYVVVRHRVLGVSVAIRRGLQYALVSRGFLVAEGLAVFLALYLGIGPLIVRAFPEAGAGGMATTNAVAAAGVVLGLGQVNRRVKLALDRRFFREPYNAQQVLANLGEALDDAAADPNRVAAALAESIAQALHAEYAEVYLAERVAIRSAATAATGMGASPSGMACAARVVLDPETGIANAAGASPDGQGADPAELLERWFGDTGAAVVADLDSSIESPANRP